VDGRTDTTNETPRITKASAVTGFIAIRPGTRLLSTSFPTPHPTRTVHPVATATPAAICGILLSARVRTRVGVPTGRELVRCVGRSIPS
jgi:hypothetical protein